MAQLLIANGIDLKQTDKDGSNALMQLCTHSKSDKIVEVAQLLIANGIDVKQTDKNGMNALMHTFNYSHSNKIVEMAEFLMARGIDLNQKDKKGRKAKHHFSSNYYLNYESPSNRAAIVRLFLQYKQQHYSRVYLNDIIMDVTSGQDVGQYI